MMIDATLALLIVVLRDGLLAWYLLSFLARGGNAPVIPQPAPIPQPPTGGVAPPQPAVPGPVAPVPPTIDPSAPTAPEPGPVPSPAPAPVPSPAPGIPRFTGITTTSFAGVSDSVSSKLSAYTGKLIDSNKPGAALPYHFPGTPPIIRVFFRGATVDCPVVDVGPWNTHDPYWDHGARPQAETGTDTTGRRTNHAGLDLTPGAWSALGKTGNLDDITDVTSWDFVSVLDKGNPPSPIPAQPSAPLSGGTVLQKNIWPSQSQAMPFFGNPASAGWEAANLVEVTCPWELTVEGTKTDRIKIHRKCALSLGRVLDYIWEQCGKSQAQINAFGYNVFDGSYNYRPIAGTSTLSEHAYGGALDFNAAANPQHATASQTKFKEDSLIVQAFKGEGWTWGGDWSPAYRDAMHFQALKA
jgi:hypothetical protein